MKTIYDNGTLIAFQGKEWRVRAYSTYAGAPAYWIERENDHVSDPLIVEAQVLHDGATVLKKP
jgi:hypothetical protein